MTFASSCTGGNGSRCAVKLVATELANGAAPAARAPRKNSFRSTVATHPSRHSFRLAPENTFASRPYERCAGCWLMNDPLETSVGQRWHLGALARRVTAYAGSTLVIILLIGASMNSAGFGAMRFRSSDA